MALPKLSQDDIDKWKALLKEAHAQQQTCEYFCKTHKLSKYEWYQLSQFVRDKSLTSWPKIGKPYDGKERVPYTSKRSYVKKSTFPIERYLQIPMEEEKPPGKQIFCLVVAFDSKEAAFKAMGQL